MKWAIKSYTDSGSSINDLYAEEVLDSTDPTYLITGQLYDTKEKAEAAIDEYFHVPGNDSTDEVTITEDGEEAEEGEVTEVDPGEDVDLIDYINNTALKRIGSNLSNSNSYKDALTKSVQGIFGLPYQFSEIVDVPLSFGENDENVSVVGRKYTEKIINNMPILFLTPGEPAFMKDYSESSKETLLNNLGSSVLSDYIGEGGELGEGKFYSFEAKSAEYYKYANVALRQLAMYMGIGDVKIPIPGKDQLMRLGKIQVDKLLNDDFKKLFGVNPTVPFYLDADSSISEGFSNDTTESSLASTANEFSSTVSEYKFLLGAAGAASISDAAIEKIDGVTDIASSILNNFGVNSSFTNRLSTAVTTIVNGGKLAFPSIWSDSSYAKSFSLNFKFRSPDPDPVSIYLNVYLPIMMLICMASPRQINNSGNAYISPFIVRATYKSIFNCDMGIITSLDISKGGENCWNTAGMATQADVTVTIADLYKNMFISNNQGLINNLAEIDFLATMAGVNLNEASSTRVGTMLAQLYVDKITDHTHNTWLKLQQWGASTVSSVVSKIPLVKKLTDTRHWNS